MAVEPKAVIESGGRRIRPPMATRPALAWVARPRWAFDDRDEGDLCLDRFSRSLSVAGTEVEISGAERPRYYRDYCNGAVASSDTIHTKAR